MIHPTTPRAALSRARRRAHRAGALVLTVLLVVLAGAGAAPAQDADAGRIGIRLLEGPSARADDPRAQSYIVDHMEPGTTISRRFRVSNDGPDARELTLYPGAATISDGEMRFGEGRQANELTEWITLDRSSVAAGAGEGVEATVTIDVPDDAAPGERYAVIWAEATSAPDAGGVTAVNRVGIRVYLSVGGDNEPASDFAISSLEGSRDADGRPTVTAQIENTGGRALDLSADLSLSEGPGGVSAGPYASAASATLGVGQSGPVTILLDPDLPTGTWTAALVARSGTLEREATASITIPEAPASSGGVVPPDPDDGTPWMVIGLAGLALVAAAAVVTWAVRGRHHPGSPSAPAVV